MIILQTFFKSQSNDPIVEMFIKKILRTKNVGWGVRRWLSRSAVNRFKVLGIETSCDDTGAAVVDDRGTILGESLYSQTQVSVQLGGVCPPIANTLHKQNIAKAVTEALQQANLRLKDVDAIATTVKPGLNSCLKVGLDYTKHLLRQARLPFIPIHHMQAHALTARMIEDIDFPFLVLLISGGHCILAVARGVDDFIILGYGLDKAPGEALDKVARRLKLKNIPEYSEMSGGRAIELLARDGDPFAFPVSEHIMAIRRNCNFSFGGITNDGGHMISIIEEQELKHGIKGGNVLPNLPDICANVQYTVALHLIKRLQRGFLYCHYADLLPKTNRTLVLSGGVASNSYISRCLQIACAENHCRLVRPPPKLCTDNGIMIAWNGVEKLRTGKECTQDVNAVEIQPKCPLGQDWSSKVQDVDIKIGKMKDIKEKLRTIK